jgi:hypothetical protein
MRRFPQPNYVLNKVAEESGEVIKAVIHYTEGREQWSNVESEIIDNLAMLLRLVTEGDQVIGFTPPDGLQTCIKHVDSDIEPHKRIISIRHKEYVHLEDGQISSHLWLEASPQPADLQTSSLVMWVKRLPCHFVRHALITNYPKRRWAICKTTVSSALLIAFGGTMKNLLRNMTAGNFNRRYPVGSRFRYYIVPGMPEVEEVVTTSEAWHVRSGRLVVRVEGKIGACRLINSNPFSESFLQALRGVPAVMATNRR